MAVKTNGEEFKRFFSDPTFWFSSTSVSEDDHTWWEDGVITVNGVDVENPEECQDTDEITIYGGIVFGKVVGSKEPTLESYFKRWKKAQTTCTLVVKVPVENRNGIIKLLTELGAKVKP